MHNSKPEADEDFMEDLFKSWNEKCSRAGKIHKLNWENKTKLKKQPKSENYEPDAEDDHPDCNSEGLTDTKRNQGA